MMLMCLAAMVEATADTVSSEIGQAFGGRPVMLLTLQQVDPGADGAVTLLGSLAGITGGGTGGGHLSIFRFVDVPLAFERAMQPSDVHVEALGGVADDLVEVAHGHVVVADVAERGPG